MNIQNEYLEKIQDLSELRHGLITEGIVEISKLFKKEFLDVLTNECIDVYSKYKIRKDFQMPETNNTPRNMYIVSEEVISEHSDIIKL